MHWRLLTRLLQSPVAVWSWFCFENTTSFVRSAYSPTSLSLMKVSMVQTVKIHLDSMIYQHSLLVHYFGTLDT